MVETGQHCGLWEAGVSFACHSVGWSCGLLLCDDLGFVFPQRKSQALTVTILGLASMGTREEREAPPGNLG
jgi:hypothetical protein